MFDASFFPNANGNTTVDWFVGTGNSIPWHKPRGKTMISILLVGRGGDGGKGAIGALAAAGGGGGGASGSQIRLIMPLNLLPDTLFVYTAPSSTSLQGESIVRAASPISSPFDTNIVCRAKGGGNGANSTAAAGGAGGSAGGTVTVTQMPVGWAFATQINGQAGRAGGASGNAGTDLYPLQTGLVVTAGNGGGGIGASGFAGGRIFNWEPYPIQPGGLVGPNGTSLTPDATGGMVLSAQRYATMFYGGSGSASGRSGATGDGLIQARGGNGAPGCGGGGNGAVFTGGTQTAGGTGGPGFCLITCW